MGPEGSQHRPGASSFAFIQLRRVQLCRRVQRSDEPGLGPTHPLQQLRERGHPGWDQVQPADLLLRQQRSAGRLHVRSRGLRRFGARSGQPHRRGDGRAVERRIAARQQHRFVDPRHRACPGRGTPDRLHHGRDRKSGRDRSGHRPLLRPRRSRVRFPGAAGRLVGLPIALHGGDARRGHRRHDQLLEPGPVPDDAVLVPLRLRLRDGARPRHGDARQRPGHARNDAYRPRPRSPRPDGHLEDAVRRRPHVAPVLPAHTGGRSGPGLGVPGLAAMVQRRPSLAGHLRLRISTRDR